MQPRTQGCDRQILGKHPDSECLQACIQQLESKTLANSTCQIFSAKVMQILSGLLPGYKGNELPPSQAELREMRVERRAQCATHLEALQEKERLTAQLSAAERASAQLRRQLDAARAAGAEACAARSALSQQLAASSGQLTALRHDSADALRRLKLAEAALEAAKEQDRKVIGESCSVCRSLAPLIEEITCVEGTAGQGISIELGMHMLIAAPQKGRALQ